MPPYAAVLVIHLLAVAVFLAGLLLVAGSLPELSRGSATPARRDELARLRAMNAWFTTPALLLVWVCGATMAVEGGWYRAGWLQAKVAVVLALSVTHVAQTRALGRLARGGAAAPGGPWRVAGIAAAATAVIALVVAKP